MSNTIRVVYSGATARVYLPDGTELRGVLNVSVETPHPHGTDVASMTIRVVDFCIEQQITKPQP